MEFSHYTAAQMRESLKRDDGVKVSRRRRFVHLGRR